jgi:hypothetical protein
MKKIKLIMMAFLATTLVALNADAQSVKGTRFLNAGIGLGTFGFSGTGGLPITASFEHGFTDKISAGATVAFVKRKFLSDYHYSYYIVGARGSYHLSEALKVENEKVDLYGGASLFYRGYKVKYKGSIDEGNYKASAGGLDFALHAGARYMFSDNIGGYAELGYGISPLQLGVTLKF